MKTLSYLTGFIYSLHVYVFSLFVAPDEIFFFFRPLRSCVSNRLRSCRLQASPSTCPTSFSVSTRSGTRPSPSSWLPRWTRLPRLPAAETLTAWWCSTAVRWESVYINQRICYRALSHQKHHQQVWFEKGAPSWEDDNRSRVETWCWGGKNAAKAQTRTNAQIKKCIIIECKD